PDCQGCHLSAVGGGLDVDDYVWGAPQAMIDQDEWLAQGHGSSVAYSSSNPAANFQAEPNGGCTLCHDETIDHNLSANYFRLRNFDFLAGGGLELEPCASCHFTGDAGIAGVNSTIEVDSAHPHASGDGGQFCWDCHDPHGDTNSGDDLWYMIQREPVDSSDQTVDYGVPNTTWVVNSFDGPGGNDGANIDVADYVFDTTFDGICQGCHADAGGASPNHYNVSTYDGHNAGGTGKCTDCHLHSAGFAPPAGGCNNCLSCHELSAQGSRRAVGADFSKNSHHVGSGVAPMGGTLTNFDCVVCHAEGEVVAGAVVSNDPQHGCAGGDATINLRDTDVTNAWFQYDKSVITTWDDSDPNWVSQTSNQLDPFCLTCHDSDGAQIINAGWGDPTATPLNPFDDAAITNEYDQQSRGAVVDIAQRVVSSGGDLDDAGEPRGADGIPDPPQGIYSRHAITGQSVSMYTTAVLPAARWAGGWDETATMSCADCHTTDGANGTDGNAHGSNTEYLLKNSDRSAAIEGTEGNANYVCWQCHDPGFYQGGGAHTGNASDFVDSTADVGGARATGGLSPIYGIACFNCHGGVGVLAGDPWGQPHPVQGAASSRFGTIHGSSDIYYVGDPITEAPGGTWSGGVTRESYRFMNGGGLRFYDPAGWTTGAGTCYTLGVKKADGIGPDLWSGCDKHNGGTTAPNRVTRALSY
ncbi:MAG: hypothetical protein JRI23_20775, partial [Deltaproteobacteria bacterium]|nr:hypothetical protein [Deltaproteobacteria bacterium]MBW2534353.1 hypothetical protein [Deltaproteobacteria bacterium]